MTNGVTKDSNTAVLIYYNNVSGGVASNSSAYAYGNTASSDGPTTALAQLPTTQQWSNVSLINTTRDITSENGTIQKSGFSYICWKIQIIHLVVISTHGGWNHVVLLAQYLFLPLFIYMLLWEWVVHL